MNHRFIFLSHKRDRVIAPHVQGRLNVLPTRPAHYFIVRSTTWVAARCFILPAARFFLNAALHDLPAMSLVSTLALFSFSETRLG
jgi:hypothetical protein